MNSLVNVTQRPTDFRMPIYGGMHQAAVSGGYADSSAKFRHSLVTFLKGPYKASGNFPLRSLRISFFQSPPKGRFNTCQKPFDGLLKALIGRLKTFLQPLTGRYNIFQGPWPFRNSPRTNVI